MGEIIFSYRDCCTSLNYIKVVWLDQELLGEEQLKKIVLNYFKRSPVPVFKFHNTASLPGSRQKCLIYVETRGP